MEEYREGFWKTWNFVPLAVHVSNPKEPASKTTLYFAAQNVTLPSNLMTEKQRHAPEWLFSLNLNPSWQLYPTPMKSTLCLKLKSNVKNVATAKFMCGWYKRAAETKQWPSSWDAPNAVIPLENTPKNHLLQSIFRKILKHNRHKNYTDEYPCLANKVNP